MAYISAQLEKIVEDVRMRLKFSRIKLATGWMLHSYFRGKFERRFWTDLLFFKLRLIIFENILIFEENHVYIGSKFIRDFN